MTSSLMLERVRRDVEVIARAGLDTPTFLAELEATLQRAVPHTATCVPTMDPATRLLTGAFKFGDLAGNDQHDHDWALIEFGGTDPTSFIEMIDQGRTACSVTLATTGEPSASPRFRDLINPVFGYGDELRMVARQGPLAWGGLVLFRDTNEAPFDAAEVAFVESLSLHLAVGLRSGLLTRLAHGVPDSSPTVGPAVLIVDAQGHPTRLSMGAEALLAELASAANTADASAIIGGLIASARRYAAGEMGVLPHARARMPSGRWLTLHASPLSGADGASGEVVVTIDEARPPEIVPLVVAAFELTSREREVTQLVLQGVETKEIAAALHMSRYTVQDHLKSVFDKADVRSRRELISRVFFDQYLPRMGSELAPSGWFAAGS